MHITQRTVLLISSTDSTCNWAGLRAILQAHESVRIVGDARTADHATASARCHQPDIIFIAAMLAGQPVVGLISALHACSPTSKIIVLGNERDYATQVVALAQAGSVGYLVWDDLTESTIYHCLATVQETNLLVGSRAVVDSVLTAGYRPRAMVDTIALSPMEAAVLRHLAASLTRPQIAQAEYMSVRTVERIIDRLQDKLDAPSMFALGYQAEVHGYILPPGLAQNRHDGGEKMP